MSTYPKSRVDIWLASVLLQVFLVLTVEMKTARYCLPCTFSTRSTDTPLRRFFLSSARILTTCRPIRGELWGHVTSSPPTTADLVVVGGQHADLALLLPAPGLGPVAPELCQPVHNLRHLRVVVEGGAGGVLAVLAPDITSPCYTASPQTSLHLAVKKVRGCQEGCAGCRPLATSFCW